MTLDEMIRELEELSELASSASGDEAETAAVRKSYAHATRLARLVKGATSRMKSADEYAEMAEQNVISATQHAKRSDAEECERRAGIWSTLAVAASVERLATATLEAARLTLDAQASNLLSALEEPEPIPVVGELDYDPCLHAWYGCALGESPDHACQLVEGHTQARHVCVCGDVSR